MFMDREANGTVIRVIRRGLDISQADLAARVGITAPYLSQIERDLRRRPSLRILRSIAQELGVPLGVISYVPESAKAAS